MAEKENSKLVQEGDTADEIVEKIAAIYQHWLVNFPERAAIIREHLARSVYADAQGNAPLQRFLNQLQTYKL